MHGIVNVFKPQEYTSHDCVAIMRRVTGIKKIGHTGTLDPMATGVLPVCIGRATKVIEFLEGDSKRYECVMKLGITTDTQDVWGNVLDSAEPVTDPDRIKTALMEFTGIIQQYPPMYSAIKVGGKKLYEYAREGKTVEVKPRNVEIYSIDIIDIINNYVKFAVHCSKGTYVRTICHDLGEKLGCGGAMCGLVRTACGKFSVDDAVNIEQIKTMSNDEIEGIIQPMDYPLDLEKIDLTQRQARDISNGKVIEDYNKPEGLYAAYYDGAFLGVSSVENDCLKAYKNINLEII